MIYHGLVCLLHSGLFKYRTTTVAANPDKRKLSEIFEHNVRTLMAIVAWCKDHGILAYRVPSSIFPLATHDSFKDEIRDILTSSLSLIPDGYFDGVHLTSHPDQFVVLSSLRSDVVASSIAEIEFHASYTDKIPLSLINVHVGSASERERNREIILRSISSLSPKAKSLLSLENDEKSWSFQEVLDIAEVSGVMMVPDIHHERCMRRRKEPNLPLHESDSIIIENLNRVHACYDGRKIPPTFHISSPREGWGAGFSSECKHADMIDHSDYPSFLSSAPFDLILEVEAKHKEVSVLDLIKNF